MDTNIEKVSKEPLVSVCMITYNRAAFLPEAIESVLKQTFTDWELIIVDDVSTDNTKEVVEKYGLQDSRIKYYSNKEHLKISASRNYSLSLAQGKYVAILDSDDVWCDSEKLRLQYEFLEAHRVYFLIGGGVVVIDKNGVEKKRYINPINDEIIRQEILLRNPFAHSSVMYDREVALKLGGYDKTLAVDEDYDLFLRIGVIGKFANLERNVLNYRIHGDNISVKDKLKMLSTCVLLVKRNKGKYPFYFKALLWRTGKMWIYRLFLKIRPKN
jgi:glycosyltransferase involved in cell wall biosynthesis